MGNFEADGYAAARQRKNQRIRDSTYGPELLRQKLTGLHAVAKKGGFEHDPMKEA
jgi:hypothetical protein